MGADWNPGITQGPWNWTALGYANSMGLWEPAGSLGSQELPNVPVVILGHGTLSVLRWAGGLGSWEHFGSLMLWKPPAGLGLVLE